MLSASSQCKLSMLSLRLVRSSGVLYGSGFAIHESSLLLPTPPSLIHLTKLHKCPAEMSSDCARCRASRYHLDEGNPCNLSTMLRRVGDVDVDIVQSYETRHNNQPPSLLLDNPMQQYDVNFCLRLELRHVNERIHNNSIREPMTIYNSKLGRDTTQYTSRFCAFHSSSRVWIVVVMRSASESKSIGPILIEHEPSYDEVIVEGRLRA